MYPNVSLEAARNVYGHLQIKPIYPEALPIPEAKPDVPTSALLDDARIKAHLPSKSTTLIDRIIAVCKKILTWLRALWSGYTPEVDQRLMAALLGEQAYKTLPQLKAAPLSAVLRYTVNFLKQEKGVPPSLLANFTQSAQWAEKIEKLKTDVDLARVEKQLLNLGQETSKAIKALKPGETCLLPGGWVGDDGEHHILYEIKRGDEGFTLRLISTDPMVNGQKTLAHGGKDKLLPFTRFHKLTEQEVAEPQWLKALFGLHLYEQGQTCTSQASLHGLLRDFMDRRVLSEEPLENYRTATSDPITTKSIAILIDEHLNPLQRKEGPARRRKLILQTSAFFEFFNSVKPTLESNQSNRLLVRMGYEKISSMTCLLHSQGQLSDADLTALNVELNCIQKALQAVEQTPPPNAAPLNQIKAPSPFAFEQKPIQLTPIEPRPNKEWQQPIETRSSAAKLAESIATKTFTCAALQPIVPPSPETIVKQLTTWREECQQMVARGETMLVQERLLLIFESFPFEPIEIDAHHNRQLNQNDFWRNLSASDRKTCSRELSQLSHLFVDAITKHDSCMPDRFLAFVKVTFTLDWLARLNESETLLSTKYYTQILSSLSWYLEKPLYGWWLHRSFGIRAGKWNLNIVENSTRYDRYFTSQQSHQVPHEKGPLGNYVPKHKYDFATYKKLFGNQPLPTQVEDLDKQLALLRQLISTDRSIADGHESEIWLFDKFQKLVMQWGRCFNFAHWRTAAFYGKLDKGYDSASMLLDPMNPEPHNVKNANQHCSQEQIVYDPVNAVRVYNSHDEYRPKGENYEMPNLTPEEWRDLLFLQSHEMSFWEMMGLIKERPHLFDDPDVQAFLDHHFFKLDEITRTLHSKGYPPEFSVFTEWLNAHIEKLRIQGKVTTALFFIDMNQRLRALAPPDKRDMFKDYASMLKEMAHASLNPAQSLYKHRQEIWMLHLQSFEPTKQINAAELQELVIGQFIVNLGAKDISQQDPLKRDAVARALARWQKPIQDLFSESSEFCQSTLDAICLANGSLIPKEPWKGTYPVYQASNYQIDVVKGTLVNLASGTSVGGIPYALQLHLEKVYPHLQWHDVAVSRYAQDDIAFYLFKDTAGYENCIRVQGSEILCFKCIHNRWVQYVAREQVLPIKKEPQPDFTKGLKYNLKLAPRLFEQTKTLPKFLIHSEYQYWIDPKQPLDLYITDAEGKALFLTRWKTTKNGKTLESVIDLRSAEITKQQAHSLNPETPSHWKLLCAIEDPRKIIVWRQGDAINGVELLRFGLRFHQNNEQIICDTPPLKEWIVDLDALQITSQKGIPQGLVLRHPTQPERKRLIVPKREVTPKEYHAPFSWNTFWTVLKSVFTKHKPAFASQDPLSQDCFLTNKSSRQEYYLFEIDPHTSELNPVSSARSAASFLYLAQMGLYTRNYQQALTYLNQAKKENPGLLSEAEKKQLEALYQYPLEDANASAIKLQAACLFSDEQKQAQFYKKYVAQLSSVDALLKLTRAQEIACLKVLKAHEPDFYNAQAPLISTEPGQKRRMKAILYDNKEDETNKKITRNLRDYIREIYISIRNHPIQSPELLQITRHYQLLGDNFLGLYKTARETDPQSPAFKELKFNLRAFAPNKTTPEYLKVCKYYLEQVIAMRETNLNNESLPKAPDFPWNDPVQNFRASATLTNFIFDLNKLIEIEKEEEFPQPKQMPTPLKDEIALKILEEDLEKALKQLESDKPGVSLAQLTLKELENKLETDEARPSAPLEIQASGDALYLPEQLKGFFEDKGTPPLPAAPDLSALKNSADSAIKLAAMDLESEITEAKNQMAKEKIFSIKDEDRRSKLEAILQKRVEDLTQKSVEVKKQILQILQPQTTALQSLQYKAKLTKVVTWERFIKQYLQQDVEALKPDLPSDANLQQLQSLMQSYLQTATQQKQLQLAIQEVRLMHSKKEGITTFSSTNLHQRLTAQRQYSLEQYPHLLLFEYLSGLMLRSDQLKLIKDLVAIPDCLRQAITGAGKTSVIFILTALLKATGKNIVTVLFPKHIFEANLADLQTKLGKFYQRNVYALRYNLQMSQFIKKKTPEGTKKISIFEEIYQNLLLTTLKKGVVVTTLESQQALEQKWISLLDQISVSHRINKVPDDLKEHFKYLTMILYQLRKREEILFDEMDKGTSPRDERHLKMDRGEIIKEFVWKDSLKIFDHLIALDNELGLMQNMQAELSPENRGKILDKAARSLAETWAIKKQIAPEIKPRFIDACVAYFRGRSEAFLACIDHTWTEEEKDTIALTKDQFHIFLPLTLSRVANVKYMRSKDGVHTVPCLSSDKPREGSEHGQILERVNYMIHDWYFTGVRPHVLTAWIKQCKQSAFNELERKLVTTIDDTTDGRLFRSIFPEHSLGDISEEDVPALCKCVNSDISKKRIFLELEIAKLEISLRKTTADGHNLISMSSKTSGASATLGCLDAVHRNIKTAGATEPGIQGRMVLNLMRKTGQSTPLEFDPANPQNIVSNVLKEDPNFQAVVDGVGALYGMPAEAIAQQLLKTQQQVKGIYHFDVEGNQKVLTAKGDQSIDSVELPTEELGLALKEAESRGADFRIGAKARFFVTANNRQPLPDILQTAGRSRNPEQQIRYGVPKGSGIKNTNDQIQSGVINNTDIESDNLFRSKKQELRDFVRNDMLEQLIDLAMAGDLNPLVERYTLYQSDPKVKILVTEKSDDFSAPGSYFRKHARIEKQTQNGLTVLTELKEIYRSLAKALHLKEAETLLNNLKYSDEVIKRLPKNVFGFDALQTDQEVEIEKDIEVEQEQEVEQETEIEKQIDATFNIPVFPKWLERRSVLDQRPKHILHTIFPTYDKALRVTENFIPLDRVNHIYRMPPQWHRKAHDRLQNPVHHIKIRKKADGRWTVLLTDIIETGETLYKDSKKPDDLFRGIYDLRLDKMIKYQGQPMSAAEEKQMHALLAQVRFFDGQYNQYSKAEFEALEAWLSQQDLDKAERYFTHSVLQFKPKDQQKYPFSPLKRLFDKLRAK